MRRRASGNVPLLIRLDHGDVLVMDGLAQSEYEHCTASELQGPRVYFTYRWVTRHTASCPSCRRGGLCPPNVCARFSRAKFPLHEGWGKWMVLGPWSSFFVNPGVCPSGQHLDSRKEGASSQWSASILLGGVLSLLVVPVGSGDGVGDCHDVANLPRVCLLISLVFHFLGKNFTLFSG